VLVVADASVLVPALAEFNASGDAVRSWLLELTAGDDLHILRNFTALEVMSAFRTLVAREKLTDEIAQEASRAMLTLPSQRHDLTQSMIVRIWSLRQNHSIYDASYIALVERLQSERMTEVVLATADRRLAGSPTLSIPIALFED